MSPYRESKHESSISLEIQKIDKLLANFKQGIEDFGKFVVPKLEHSNLLALFTAEDLYKLQIIKAEPDSTVVPINKPQIYWKRINHDYFGHDYCRQYYDSICGEQYTRTVPRGVSFFLNQDRSFFEGLGLDISLNDGSSYPVFKVAELVEQRRQLYNKLSDLRSRISKETPKGEFFCQNLGIPNTWIAFFGWHRTAKRNFWNFRSLGHCLAAIIAMSCIAMIFFQAGLRVNDYGTRTEKAAAAIENCSSSSRASIAGSRRTE